MPITIEPESGIPFPFDTNPEEIEQFRERAKAAVETIKEIIQLGGEIEITPEDRAQARSAASGNTTLKINEQNAGALTHLEAILSEYDKDLLNVTSRLRSYVTNKLLLETIDEDARVRIKALELLGKVSSVGLFSERVEMNVKHRKIEDVDNELTTILEKYLGPVQEVEEDGELEEVIKQRSLLELSDEELGLSSAPQDAVQQEPKETLNGSEDLSRPASQ
jgi:hypothetical protein